MQGLQTGRGIQRLPCDAAEGMWEMSRKKPRRTDLLVRAARRRGWEVITPRRTAGTPMWYSACEKMPYFCITFSCDTDAQAWKMLKACLRIALGKGKR